jgi:plasmid stabilization system protein ParE
MSRSRWTVRLTVTADADMRDIFAWTAKHFGIEQDRLYKVDDPGAALRDVSNGPDAIAPGSVPTSARISGRGRDVILFTASYSTAWIWDTAAAGRVPTRLRLRSLLRRR